LRSESRSRVEYKIPTNIIIVLDSYFNLTHKSDLIIIIIIIIIVAKIKVTLSHKNVAGVLYTSRRK